LFEKYRQAFPAGYREAIPEIFAASDIQYLESLNADKLLALNFYETEREGNKEFNLKIYQSTNAISLSEVMPVLENMGMRVLGEHPYEIKLAQGTRWITEFSMQSVSHAISDIQKVKHLFESAFEAIWLEQAENDGFNKLVTLSELAWRQVVVIRAMARYLRQMGVSYNQEYIEKVFIAYPSAAKLLFHYFELRFNPEKNQRREEQLLQVEKKFMQLLETVSSLDEDKVLRAYLSLLKGMLRTNYYQLNNKQVKHYVSFKFDSSLLDLPKPKPMFEVFVYSVRFEAIHLRGGKVARGGIRWSDRRDDFRTEVLGLMKAQQVKNSVIVPTGAKGGFILKKASKLTTREAFMAEGISCYKDFIRGLLDITDNYKGKEIISPINVIKYDDVDPYLVVAADKGTATFSDFANEVSAEYNFWLADAFASGGKTGYDHKRMAITARGGWVSVTRHFQMLGVDIQNTDFTVAGIGDMAGDVFGNGMLLSHHIKLVAAFNHQHIFIDPNPNAEKSFMERERLFNLPRSSWADYSAKLMSKGGGVFSRDLKSIKLTKEMKELLDLSQDMIAPNDLINTILKMRVDLLWNGGIGTYVKASHELDNMAGDRTNDAVRINGDELRCRVVGEGGNLGFTQAGRVEYALNGGSIYTDFIDNSGGVDCSDKEVNIKILLNEIVAHGKLTMPARNKLLKEMTDEVGHLVLHDNYRQTQALEIASYQAVEQIDLYSRFTGLLEEKGIIERKLESLPSADEFLNRKVSGKGLTPPEIAVLLSYSKLFLKKRLLSSNVTEDKYLAQYLFTAFPKRLVTKFEKDLTAHRLSREIIITQLSNDIVNEMGAVFVYRIYHETGANYVDIARAYVVARDIFGLPELWKSIQSLERTVAENIKIKMMLLVTKLIRRATRWFIRRYHQDLDIVALLKMYKENVGKASKILPSILCGERKEHFDKMVSEFLEAGVPEALAIQVASTDPLFSLLDILNQMPTEKPDLKTVLSTYYSLSEELKLSWLRYQIRNQKNETHWDDLALVGVLDDVDRLQAKLMTSAMSYSGKNNDEKMDAWRKANHRLLSRWLKTIVVMRKNINLSMVMLFVALHDLIDFSNACASQKSKGKKS
jgi:glutamate dehydrogenase